MSTLSPSPAEHEEPPVLGGPRAFGTGLAGEPDAEMLERMNAEERARQKAAQAWLTRRMKGLPARYVRLAILSGLVGGLAVIAQAAALAWIVHQAAIVRADLATLALGFLGFLAASGIRVAGEAGRDLMGGEAALALKARVRRECVEAALSGRGAARTMDSGTLSVTLVEQIEQLEGYAARYAPQRMLAGLVPFIIMVAAFTQSWVIGVLFLVTGPLVPVFMALIGMGARAAGQRQVEQLARMGGAFLDRLRGLTTLKLFGRAGAAAENIRYLSDEYRKRTMGVLRIAFLSSAVLEFFAAVAVAVVAVYVGFGLLKLITIFGADQMTLFAGLFCLILAPEFFQPLRRLAAHYHDRANALAAVGALAPLARPDTEDTSPEEARAPESAAPALNAPPALRFHHVRHVYPGGRVGLADLTAEVPAGTSLALVGPSGAGKSTALSLLLGLEALQEGSITVDGRALQALDPAAWRAGLAWVGQTPVLFHGTLAENIALAGSQSDRPDAERLHAAAREAGVLDFAQALPDGLDAHVGERGFGLSGGQAQRLALARAFYRDAPVVILDEPTAGLDSEAKTRVLEAVARLMKGRTCILVTHDPEVARLCDRAVTLGEGGAR